MNKKLKPFAILGYLFIFSWLVLPRSIIPVEFAIPSLLIGFNIIIVVTVKDNDLVRGVRPEKTRQYQIFLFIISISSILIIIAPFMPSITTTTTPAILLTGTSLLLLRKLFISEKEKTDVIK